MEIIKCLICISEQIYSTVAEDKLEELSIRPF